jgi:hypothetical protein
MTPTNLNRRSVENVLRRAARARATGHWPAWRWHPVPDGVPGGQGWTRDVRRAAENGVWSVLVRDVETPWGTVQHAMISIQVAGSEPTWPEKQRIKDTLFGRDRVAVEVFPPHAEIVDGADAYHLWVLPRGFRLPFTLAEPPR